MVDLVKTKLLNIHIDAATVTVAPEKDSIYLVSTDQLVCLMNYNRLYVTAQIRVYSLPLPGTTRVQDRGYNSQTTQ